jgi:uncharacterized peroxidase-related enzyme
MDLYMNIMYDRSPLSRAQREMMAVVVSRENQCAYCISHHAEALDKFWKNGIQLQKLKDGHDKEVLDEADYLLACLAKESTLHPSSDLLEDLIFKLKKTGLEERAILDATLVIAYFNFVNRIVLTLGVTLEEDQGKGYHYD